MSITEKTASEYQRIAESWLTKHVDGLGVQRTPRAIAVALEKWSDGKRPGTFRKMRRALAHHQREGGFAKAVTRIEQVQRIGHSEANTTKTRRCKSVKESDHQRLLDDALERDDAIMAAALRIAHAIGARPAEMPSMAWAKHPKDASKMIIKAIGAKKNEEQNRGMDKFISLDFDPALAAAIDQVSGIDEREVTNLKRRVSRRSHTIFSRRKHPPTLYSYRHQMGSDVKAGAGDRRRAAAIMGHASQESLEVYGHRNAAGGLKRSIPAVAAQSIQAVDPTPPRTPPAASVDNSRHQEKEGPGPGRKSRHERDNDLLSL